jgi:hypothetical protein
MKRIAYVTLVTMIAIGIAYGAAIAQTLPVGTTLQTTSVITNGFSCTSSGLQASFTASGDVSGPVTGTWSGTVSAGPFRSATQVRMSVRFDVTLGATTLRADSTVVDVNLGSGCSINCTQCGPIDPPPSYAVIAPDGSLADVGLVWFRMILSDAGGSISGVYTSQAAGQPLKVFLAPQDDTNFLGVNSSVTATVTDRNDVPVGNYATYFFLHDLDSGDTLGQGSCLLDAAGQCTISIPSPAEPRHFELTAHVDNDRNGCINNFWLLCSHRAWCGIMAP